MNQQTFGDALVAVIGSGHALLHSLTLEDAAISTSGARKSLREAALRLIDLVDQPAEHVEHLAAQTLADPTVSLRNGVMTSAEHKHAHTKSIQTSSSTINEPVIIIGAGIGGLCLAQGLKRAGREFRVFERDASLYDRPQGYRLKIEKNAAEALEATLTDACFEAFKVACAITTSGQTDYNPINGQMTNSRSGGGLAGSQGLSASYTVDRGVFRKILMTGIEDNIIFDKQLLSYDLIDDRRTILATFKDGLRVHGQFLVGADGARSSIRRQLLPEMKYVNTGAVCIYGKTPLTPTLQAQVPGKALRRMTAFVDRAPSIQSILIGESPLTLLSEPIRFSSESRASMQLPQDYVYWAMIGRKELFADTPSIDACSSFEAAKLSLELTKEWDDSMSALLRLQDFEQCSALPVVSAMPEIPPWQPSDRVTLLGDAVHAMSPCGGVGANTALEDAAELAQLFGSPMDGVGYVDPTAEDVGRYEASMRKRAFAMITRSYVGSRKMFDQRPFGECPAVDW